MRWRVITVGKPKWGFITSGVERYLKRLNSCGICEWVTIREVGSREAEGQALLKASRNGYKVILDERGSMVNSRQLAEKVSQWELQAHREVNFLIGGADGHADAVRSEADWVFSLSQLTFQHEVALLVLMEQLYRAQTIRRGEPYHRD